MAKKSAKKAPKKEIAARKKEHKKLTAMRANPRNDWKIDDLKTVANSIGIEVVPGGKHFAASSGLLQGQLTIPAKRPIKPFYVRNFVEMCDAHIEAMEAREGDGK